MAFGDPVIKTGSIKLALVGQLHNIFGILKLVANVYMVDHILWPPEEMRDQRTRRCLGGLRRHLLEAGLD